MAQQPSQVKWTDDAHIAGWDRKDMNDATCDYDCVGYQIRREASYGKTFLHPSNVSRHLHIEISGKFEFHRHLLQCKEFVFP